MSMTMRDSADPSQYVHFSNGHFERLMFRGVLMPAGVFMFPEAPQKVYLSDRHDCPEVSGIKATAAEARACAMAMRTYGNAVRDADAKGREWVDRLDRELAAMGDAIVEFLATCQGFNIP
jgi:hypothetical protein